MLAIIMAGAVLSAFDPERLSGIAQSTESGLVALYSPAPDAIRRVPQKSVGQRQPDAVAHAMPVCGGGKRMNCVVDGDTFWLNGEKIRIEGIDAPEVKGKCRRETDLAAKATKRLSALLSQRSIKIERNGKDRFGRKLMQVEAGRGDVGGALIREGLAREYAGGRRGWCDG